MGWPPWPFSSSIKSSSEDPKTQHKSSSILLSSEDRKELKTAWSSPYPPYDLAYYLSPGFLIPCTVIVGGIFGCRALYNAWLRRMPVANSVPAEYLAKRNSIFGVVTSVGDGDGFRLFHTPGGRLTGWGWLPGRKIPTGKALKDKTISVRIAGIDAPETAHFGKPAQPGGPEALAWLRSFLLGKRVRCHMYKKDQYDRIVASVKVRRFGGLLRQDLGRLMLWNGHATVYEAKTGAVFESAKMEWKYRKTMWWARALKKGIWKNVSDDWESPREFKTRTGTGDTASQLKNP